MNMQLRSKQRILLLIRVIDVFSKYAWVVSLRDKKGIVITNAFQKPFSSLISKQKINGWTKAVTFTTDL